MEQQSYYIQTLKEKLSQNQKRNPYYSLRAFARKLDIHAATLGQVLAGKRGLPYKRAYDISLKLALSPAEQNLFMQSFYKSKTNIDEIKVPAVDDRFVLDESYYKVIAEWEYYAVLELFDLEYYEISNDYISQKFNIKKNRAEVILNNLLRLGLITKNEKNIYAKAYPDIKTTEDIASNALKKSHIETLEMGIDKINEIEMQFRDFSSETLAIDLKKIPEAKIIIREFRQKMIALLKDGNKTEVYQLAIQLYPLSLIENDKEKL